ncbi:hypothetical protein HU200_012164 [Digitaria exilis]|uniref:DUF6598 domain-containing protein n=1 Tax=Digitaria exilis TaxID=1010633 RepID=A0A835KPY5_9POAL|nr:hypothetical protein HU200_012164 [Digitaria exilis]
MPVNGSGVIQLSRQVVSVELTGELKVDVVAYHVDEDHFCVAKGSVLFTPKEAAISYETCDLGFCKLGVTVGWSLFAPVEHEPWGRLLRQHTAPSSKGT